MLKSGLNICDWSRLLKTALVFSAAFLPGQLQELLQLIYLGSSKDSTLNCHLGPGWTPEEHPALRLLPEHAAPLPGSSRLVERTGCVLRCSPADGKIMSKPFPSPALAGSHWLSPGASAQPEVLQDSCRTGRLRPWPLGHPPLCRRRRGGKVGPFPNHTPVPWGCAAVARTSAAEWTDFREAGGTARGDSPHFIPTANLSPCRASEWDSLVLLRHSCKGGPLSTTGELNLGTKLVLGFQGQQWAAWGPVCSV